MEDVLITGIGIVSPIGIGRDAVRNAIEAGATGVVEIDDFAAAGWLAPYGGLVNDFDPKKYVKPRKSLKVMAHEIQMAFAAAELAVADAGLEEGLPDSERSGVVLGAGSMYGDLDELVDPYRKCTTDDGFDFNEWGEGGMGEFFPLWMLKYLPNMPACHIGIRHDAHGPNNTISHSEASSLLALAEATHVIRRGQADLMFVGGTSSRLSITDLLWHGGARLAQGKQDAATLSKPFDANRQGMVLGEGSAVFVLESRSHAERRGRAGMARVLSVASRSCQIENRFDPPQVAIQRAFSVALEQASAKPGDLSHVNAHGVSTLEDDPAEAQAIAAVLAGADVPVTAPKSYFGNLGAGGGAVELAVSLLMSGDGLVPATINHQQTDPSCPVRVAVANEPTDRSLFACLNHTNTGQAVAAILSRE